MAKSTRPRAVTTRLPLESHRSTVEQGSQFEKTVEEVFRDMPNATVEPHVLIGGKDVDLYVVVKTPLSNEMRIAIDTKDYARPLTRDQAAAELMSYSPLLQQRLVDQVMLVTRNGVATKAKLVFDGKSTVHHTVEELQNLIVNPSNLIESMEHQFFGDKLNEFYVRPQCFKFDIKRAATTYDEWYNEFIAFAWSRHLMRLKDATAAWTEKHGDVRLSVPKRYNEKSFREALAMRRRERDNLQDLELLILDWLSDASCNFGIALLGSYGTGKSSFARRIAYVVALACKQGKADRIPLLIELKEFGSHQSMEGLITHTLVNKYGFQNGSYAMFQRMNERGRYLLILDGFDEMKQGMTRDALLFNFREIGGLLRGRSRVILCGWPTIFESEEEQVSVLSGLEFSQQTTTAKYIPVEVAPFDVETTLSLIIGFVKARSPEDLISITTSIDRIRRALEVNAELADLLSRPVHVPMFVTVLPNYEGDIGDLDRRFLYETFINKTISREVQRLPPAYQNRYTAEERFQFAGMLAVEIAKMGDARSIRRSEIPSHVFGQFVKPGESLDIARRDLVAACFLERKEPDILTFGHKSFLEFLVASRIVSLIKVSDLDIASSLVNATDEIGSFVIDLSSAEDMLKFLEGGTATQDFCVDCLRTCFHTVTFTDPTHSELINIYAARKDSIAQPSRRSFPWTADVSRKGGIILRDVFDSSRLDVLRTNSTPDFIRTKLCGLLVLYLAQQSKPHMDHSKWVRWFDIAGDEWRPTIAQLAVQCEDLNEEEAFRLAGVRLREASFAGRMHESTILVETLFRMRGHIAFGGSRVTDLVEARSEA